MTTCTIGFTLLNAKGEFILVQLIGRAVVSEEEGQSSVKVTLLLPWNFKSPTNEAE